jgi:pyruvate formate lyase activating enzyme
MPDDEGFLQPKINDNLCVACGKCADACPANALSLAGKYMDEKEILDIILKDREYYEKSGGGLTVSGGECLLYPDFVQKLLKLCKEENINTLIETAFNIPWQSIEKVLPYTDMFSRI